MSIDFQRTTRRYIPEDNTLHNHRCENRILVVYVNTGHQCVVGKWNLGSSDELATWSGPEGVRSDDFYTDNLNINMIKIIRFET
jgi:hypothetical protein